MNAAQRRRLEQQRDALLARLHTLPNLMRGSLYERGRKCGRASCACAQGGPKHSTRQLTVTLGGRTRSRYIRVEEWGQVQALLATYEELWTIVNELTAVNLTLLHSTAPRERGRPR
jgi:dissimilatory sulfite reductase (desulfoviridin) alpha/beta subunit